VRTDSRDDYELNQYKNGDLIREDRICKINGIVLNIINENFRLAMVSVTAQVKHAEWHALTENLPPRKQLTANFEPHLLLVAFDESSLDWFNLRHCLALWLAILLEKE
jgi:hypothetical protein